MPCVLSLPLIHCVISCSTPKQSTQTYLWEGPSCKNLTGLKNKNKQNFCWDNVQNDVLFSHDGYSVKSVVLPDSAPSHLDLDILPTALCSGRHELSAEQDFIDLRKISLSRADGLILWVKFVYSFFCVIFFSRAWWKWVKFYKLFEETLGKNTFCINEMVIIIKLELNQRLVKEI